MVETKKLLAAVYTLNLVKGRTTASDVAKSLGLDKNGTDKNLEKLTSRGFIKLDGDVVSLTPKGRRTLKVIFIGGGFEVIHRGHLYTIEKARSMGDVLVVSVARDTTIRQRKRRNPLANEVERQRLLSSLRQVDAAILGVHGDIYKTLERVGPDVVALGYDQHHSEAEIAREASKRGIRLKVVRLDSPYPKIKTSSLLNET